MSKLFKNNGKKFKKVKRLRATILEQGKTIQRLEGAMKVKQQQIDQAANLLIKANEE